MAASEIIDPRPGEVPATKPEVLRRAAAALAKGDREEADAWMRLADRLPG